MCFGSFGIKTTCCVAKNARFLHDDKAELFLYKLYCIGSAKINAYLTLREKKVFFSSHKKWQWLKSLWGKEKILPERDCRTSLSLAKSGMVGKSKNRQSRWALKTFFTAPSTFNKCEQKHGPSEKRDGNCHIFANSHWEILPPLLLAGCRYLGISQRLSYTL